MSFKDQKPDVIVLGAGPAGLAASVELAKQGLKVALVEKQSHVGGNASSFSINDLRVDFGSHRLHPASDERVLASIRDLLGPELLTRPRHGRIRLLGRWIHFPLRPLDLLLRLHPKFGLGVLKDLVIKIFAKKSESAEQQETFASVLSKGLGKTICEEFYFPYSRKIWGLQPTELSASQAYKRVSAGSLGKMIKRLLPTGTGKGGASTKGIFFYPRNGFGQICDALLSEAERLGVEVLLDANINQIHVTDDSVAVELNQGERIAHLTGSQLFSTIPLTLLGRLINDGPPPAIKDAIGGLKFRSMVLVYLELKTDQFTEYDAHYFPGADIPFTRISEPKNYTDTREPVGRTVLCAEVPCFIGDEIWNLDENAFTDLVLHGLKKAELHVEASVLSTSLRRIPHAYPLYTNGYELAFGLLDTWLEQYDRVLSFGRQGLYAHDNTHHAIFMAMEAARCLEPGGGIDKNKWKASRKLFESHVVED